MPPSPEQTPEISASTVDESDRSVASIGGSAIDALEVWLTCESDAETEHLAELILERRLGVCVQSWPIRSRYRWNGSIERADEKMMVIKTRRDRVDGLLALIDAEHSYEVPAVVVIEPERVSGAVSEWLDTELGSARPESGSTP